MEHESQQYLDAAKTGIDFAHKTGALKKIFDLLTLRRSSEQPTEKIDYQEKALIALRENALETLASLELTMQEALRILGPGFSLDDLDKVNSTWQRHWTSGASKVGVDDEDRHVWWGRLVAGEIQQPGTFSLRTMTVMDTLSTAEARLFAKVCTYVWKSSNPVLILPTDDSSLWKPSFDEGALLESVGLVKFDSSGRFTWGITDERIKNLIRQGQAVPLFMGFHEESFLVVSTKEKIASLRCGRLVLTDVGKEMYRLTTPDCDLTYRDEILSEWRESYTIQQVSTLHAQDQ